MGWYKGPLPYYDGSVSKLFGSTPIYPEHNDEYLQECLDNLRSKGIEIPHWGGLIFFLYSSKLPIYISTSISYNKNVTNTNQLRRNS